MIIFIFLCRDFEITLKQMNWPFTMNEITDNAKLNNFKQQFQRLANMLIKVQLPYPFYKQYKCTQLNYIMFKYP